MREPNKHVESCTGQPSSSLLHKIINKNNPLKQSLVPEQPIPSHGISTNRQQINRSNILSSNLRNYLLASKERPKSIFKQLQLLPSPKQNRNTSNKYESDECDSENEKESSREMLKTNSQLNLYETSNNQSENLKQSNRLSHIYEFNDDSLSEIGSNPIYSDASEEQDSKNSDQYYSSIMQTEEHILGAERNPSGICNAIDFIGSQQMNLRELICEMEVNPKLPLLTNEQNAENQGENNERVLKVLQVVKVQHSKIKLVKVSVFIESINQVQIKYMRSQEMRKSHPQLLLDYYEQEFNPFFNELTNLE